MGWPYLLWTIMGMIEFPQKSKRVFPLTIKKRAHDHRCQQWHSNDAGRLSSKSSFMPDPGSGDSNKFLCNLCSMLQRRGSFMVLSLCFQGKYFGFSPLFAHCLHLVELAHLPHVTIFQRNDKLRRGGSSERSSAWLVGSRNGLSKISQANSEFLEREEKMGSRRKKC